MTAIGLTEKQFEGFLDMWRVHRNRYHSTPSKPRGLEPVGLQDIVVCLLETIDDYLPHPAAVMVRGNTSERQIFELRGSLTEAAGADVGGATFRLNWRPPGSDESYEETTDLLSYDASPADIVAALEALPSINPGDVRVQLGKSPRPDRVTDGDYVLSRWILEWTGQYAGLDVPLIDAEIAGGSSFAWTTEETTILLDTGQTVDVQNVIPVGQPSPLRVGAIAVAAWIETFGWVLHAVEARQISVVY